MFFKGVIPKRLDIEFTVFLGTCVGAIMILGLLGGLWLADLENQKAAAIEQEYIEKQLVSLKDKLTGDILLERHEAIQNSLTQARLALNLNRLKVSYGNQSAESADDRNFRSLIFADEPLMVSGREIGRLSYEAGSKFDGVSGRVLTFILLLFFILIMMLSVFVSRWLQTRFFDPIRELMATCEEDNAVEKLQSLAPSSLELTILRDQLVQLVEDQRQKGKMISELEKRRCIAEMAQQVAHDIRSPLAALNVLLSQTDHMPEGIRPLMRGAVTRIRDIANNLLVSAGKANPQVPGEKQGTYLVSGSLESMVSEKRVSYRNRAKVNLQVDYLDGGPYGHFSRLDIIEFRRVLSNLINNAIESYGEEGGPVWITQGLSTNPDFIAIEIRDEGCGIPASVISQLGQPGVTYRKANGNGLGISHSKKTIEGWGGQILIDSVEGKGTKVTLLLKRAEAPKWFLPELRITSGQTIVILDDDEAIHQTWNRLLAPFTQLGTRIINFRIASELKHWLSANRDRDFLGLFDYELIGQGTTGLALIEEFELERRAILVTGRAEEDTLMERCEARGVRMVPKGLVERLPLVEEKTACMN